jgi:SAM-dependent methyltransferase
VHPVFLRIARAIYYRLYRAKLRLQFFVADHIRFRPSPFDEAVIPPALLRFRVGENIDPALFLAVGENASNDIEAALLRAGCPLETCHTVLDFGCGCARIVSPLARRFPQVHFHGTDVDTMAIEWCRVHLPAVTFQSNGPLPPLFFADGEFDLIYCVSVFTHLSAELGRQWLRELHRVLRPGGTLLITVHGKNVWFKMPSERRKRIEREGHLFVMSAKLRGIVPDWYHTAYHSEEYAREWISSEFRLLEYIPCGLGYQDVVIAERSR